MGLKIIVLTDGSREVLVQNLFIAFIITFFFFFLKKSFKNHPRAAEIIWSGSLDRDLSPWRGKAVVGQQNEHGSIFNLLWRTGTWGSHNLFLLFFFLRRFWILMIKAYVLFTVHVAPVGLWPFVLLFPGPDLLNEGGVFPTCHFSMSLSPSSGSAWDNESQSLDPCSVLSKDYGHFLLIVRDLGGGGGGFLFLFTPSMINFIQKIRRQVLFFFRFYFATSLPCKDDGC